MDISLLSSPFKIVFLKAVGIGPVSVYGDGCFFVPKTTLTYYIVPYISIGIVEWRTHLILNIIVIISAPKEA